MAADGSITANTSGPAISANPNPVADWTVAASAKPHAAMISASLTALA